MNTWFISDTHFNHKNIIGFCQRPFKTVEEMNEVLIEKWNSKVKKKDIIWHLGDFGFGSLIELEKIVLKLNGIKNLILGNHERFTFKKYQDIGFNFVSRHHVIIENNLILSHKRLKIEKESGFKNIFGHEHNATPLVVAPWLLNISCENTNYEPLPLTVLRSFW